MNAGICAECGRMFYRLYACGDDVDRCQKCAAEHGVPGARGRFYDAAKKSLERAEAIEKLAEAIHRDHPAFNPGSVRITPATPTTGTITFTLKTEDDPEWTEIARLPAGGRTDSTRCADCDSPSAPGGPRWRPAGHDAPHCYPCYQRHVLPPIPAPPAPRLITYCESAPPREVVESLIVRCGDGLEGGKPVMAPSLWTRAMRLEWERHEAWLAKMEGWPVARIGEREAPLPSDLDRYGGHALRAGALGCATICRLCGGVVRSISLPAKEEKAGK